MKDLKPIVFWVPFTLLLASSVYSLIDTEQFLKIVKAANDWILSTFGWLFAISTFIFLILCVWAYFSKLGKVRIGGEQAKPLLSKWRWFSITLCTTVAIGILFWATAEPLYHLHETPDGIGAGAGSEAAARFSLSTMFLHWTFTPYGIYTLTGLVFALAYYNLKMPYSLSSMLYPLFGRRLNDRTNQIIDAVCLYSLVAGMAASLGAGMLTIAGGINTYTGWSTTPMLLFFVGLAIVAAFIISSISGLKKGIRILSNINAQAFFALVIFVFIFGPTLYMFSSGVAGFGEYIRTFVPRSLGLGLEQDWFSAWTLFYWANWLAWAPVTAAFLGRLAYGYTVRDFIVFNLVLPSLFSCAWMMIFSSTALHIDYVQGSGILYESLQQAGPESIMYKILEGMPLPQITSFVFLLIAFISYVTAADSNTSAMSGLSSTGISPSNPEPPQGIKIIWGGIVGLIAWVMVSFAGIDGVKMTSTLGGFPALFLIIIVAMSLVRLLLRPGGLDKMVKQP